MIYYEPPDINEDGLLYVRSMLDIIIVITQYTDFPTPSPRISEDLTYCFVMNYLGGHAKGL